MTLREHFLNLLGRHVRELTIRGQRTTGLCPFHPDRHPSFSANLDKCVWHCFPCGRGGGVKDFASAVGEEWSSSRSESRASKARRARFQVEQQARAILERRAEERDKAPCTEHRELYGEALSCADLLSVFYQRHDLAAEFSDVLVDTEREYGAMLFRLTVIEAKLNGEVAI